MHEHHAEHGAEDANIPEINNNKPNTLTMVFSHEK